MLILLIYYSIMLILFIINNIYYNYMFEMAIHAAY